MRPLLVATRNKGKLAEFSAMLAGIQIAVVGLAEIERPVADVDETGTTFAENARLKASGYARQSGLHTLADDSGLEVAALGGRPGVHSARYGGEETPYPRKIESLLRELSSMAGSDRSARFFCSLAVADPTGSIIFEAEGTCPGRIAAVPAGSGGFGYDPVFIPHGFDETFAELPGSIKARVGHRGRAFAQIVPFLGRFYAVST